MKIFKIIKINLETIYLSAMCLFWLTLFVYFRFIQKRSSYQLTDLKVQVTDYFLLTNFIFIFLHILLIIYALYLIYIKTKKVYVSGKFTQIIQNVINTLFMKPFIKLRSMIAPYIPYSGLFFCHITTFLENKNLIWLKVPVIIFNFIPRIIVSIIFFVELIVYNRIYYFIPSIFLLLLPILWNLFLNLYVNFAERGLFEIPQYIEITPIGEPLSNGWCLTYSFKPLPQYTYAENDMKECIFIHIMILPLIMQKTIHSKSLSFISDLLLSIFPLVVFYHHIIIDYSLSAYYCIIFLVFLFFALSSYVKLYHWRNLAQSVSSFIFFVINLIQLFLYLWAIRSTFFLMFCIAINLILYTYMIFLYYHNIVI